MSWIRRTCLIVVLLLLSLQAYSAGIKIDRLYQKNKLVYVSVKSFVKDAIDLSWILNQGIDVKARYSITLYRKNKRWGGDIPVTNTVILFKSKKDVINEGYEVTLETDIKKSDFWISSQESLFAFILHTPVTPVVTLYELDPNEEYYLQLQLSITSLELYPPLSLIYQLLGRWSYTTPKINSRIFTYDSILEN